MIDTRDEKVREDGVIHSQAIITAIGIDCEEFAGACWRQIG